MGLVDDLEENKKLITDTVKTLKSQQNNTLSDEYDNGFYNGIELALSLLEKRKPKFKSRS